MNAPTVGAPSCARSSPGTVSPGHTCVHTGRGAGSPCRQRQRALELRTRARNAVHGSYAVATADAGRWRGGRGAEAGQTRRTTGSSATKMGFSSADVLHRGHSWLLTPLILRKQLHSAALDRGLPVAKAVTKGVWQYAGPCMMRGYASAWPHSGMSFLWVDGGKKGGEEERGGVNIAVEIDRPALALGCAQADLARAQRQKTLKGRVWAGAWRRRAEAQRLTSRWRTVLSSIRSRRACSRAAGPVRRGFRGRTFGRRFC